jgi:O-acetyl-ADP-ribose deacetylase (regulator of RNase III)
MARRGTILDPEQGAGRARLNTINAPVANNKKGLKRAMIYEVTGDILLTRAEVVAHGVAPNDPMSQGLSLSLHKRFPAMHKDYHHWCKLHHPKPGEAWVWSGPGGLRIVNLLTQDGGYGHGARPGKATLKHVSDSLRALAKMISRESFTSLALPRIATGVGGLDWESVWPLIQERLGDVEIPVYVYTDFQPGQRAREPQDVH